MLLIVEDNWGVILSYRNALATHRKVEGLDFVYARSFEEARDAFQEYGDAITMVIVDHHLEGKRTGLDVVRAIREREHPDIKILRCSAFNERGYPDLPFYNKNELREVIAATLRNL